jgi:uncharacterized membrane protein YbhN (UPF0104 family)
MVSAMSTDLPPPTPAPEGDGAEIETPVPGAPGKMTKQQKRRQIIQSGIGLIATGIVLYFVLKWFGSQGASIEQVITDIKGMTTLAIIALLLATLFNLMVYPLPYQASTLGLKYPPAFVVRQTSFTISNTIPFGGAIGLGVQYGMFGTYEVAPTAIVATLAISSVWTELMTLGLPVLGLLGLIVTGEATQQLVIWGLIGLVGVILIVGILVIVLRSLKGAEWVGDKLNAISGWFFRLIKKRPPNVKKSLLKFRHDTVDVLKARWWRITWTNLLVQLGMFSIMYFAMIGLTNSTNTHMPTLIQCFAAFAISRIGTLVPVPGGLGPTDAIMVQLLENPGGATSTVAIAADLVWRILYFAVPIGVGVLTFLWWQFVAAPRHRKKLAGVAS